MISFAHILSGNSRVRSAAAGLIRRLQTTVEHIRVTNTEIAPMVRGEVFALAVGERQAVLADANSAVYCEWVGVCCEGIAVDGTGIGRTNGLAYCLFEEGLDPAPAAGDIAYVSMNTPGRLTNDLPVTGGVDPVYQVEVGIIEDASEYATDSSSLVQLQRCCNTRN